jgi:hypothetical protein
MRTTPSAEVQELGTYFDEFLAHESAKIGTTPDADWQPCWRRLSEGGWLNQAGLYDARPSLSDSLVDLGYLAEIWARHMIPLPFTQAVVLELFERSAADLEIASVDGRVLVPHPGWLSSGKPSLEEVDDFATSLPIGSRDTPSGALADDDLMGAHAALLTAEAVGCANIALETAIAYAQTRQAYGQAVSSFQAIRHLFADMHTNVELARTGVVLVVQGVGDQAGQDAIRRCISVVTSAIQVHGGMGFTWEIDLHRYLRHILAVSKLFKLFKSGT